LTTANTPSTLLAPSRRDSALAVHTERTVEAAARRPLGPEGGYNGEEEESEESQEVEVNSRIAD